MGEASGAPATLNTEYQTFARLHKLGQRAMRRFLDSHFDDIGRRSTIDMPQEAARELVE
jgi:NTE family protein